MRASWRLTFVNSSKPMNKSNLIRCGSVALLWGSLAAGAQAQTAQLTQSLTNSTLIASNTFATPLSTVVPYDQTTERGPHHRIHQYTRQITNALGQLETITNKYTQLETGLHYKGDNGEWLESKAEIEIQPGGAVARKGPHKVIFASQIHSAGAIDLLTPDGKRLR